MSKTDHMRPDAAGHHDPWAQGAFDLGPDTIEQPSPTEVLAATGVPAVEYPYNPYISTPESPLTTATGPSADESGPQTSTHSRKRIVVGGLAGLVVISGIAFGVTHTGAEANISDEAGQGQQDPAAVPQNDTETAPSSNPTNIPSTSETEEPVSYDIGYINKPPLGTLDGLNVDQQRTVYNETIIPALQSYIDALVAHPGEEDLVPTDGLSSTPDSDLIRGIQSIVRQERASHPDTAQILPQVCPVSAPGLDLSKFGCDPQVRSDLWPTSVEYNDKYGSEIRIQVVYKNDLGMWSDEFNTHEVELGDYTVQQAADGTVQYTPSN